MNTWIPRTSLAVVLGVVTPGLAAEVDVIDWTLKTTVSNFAPTIPLVDSERSDVPESPFAQTMSVTVGPEDTAVGIFDVSWLNNSGAFHLAAEQHLHGPERGASSNATVFFTTTIDVVFSASGSMMFASTPGDDADFIYGVSIEATDPLMQYYSASGVGGDLNLFTPASGSLAFDSGKVLLPAGHTYRVFLNLASHTYIHADQDPISASGEINFSWHPVPEPATGVLFAFAGIALLRRRRCPVSSTSPTHDAPSPAVP